MAVSGGGGAAGTAEQRRSDGADEHTTPQRPELSPTAVRQCSEWPNAPTSPTGGRRTLRPAAGLDPSRSNAQIDRSRAGWLAQSGIERLGFVRWLAAAWSDLRPWRVQRRWRSASAVGGATAAFTVVRRQLRTAAEGSGEGAGEDENGWMGSQPRASQTNWELTRTVLDHPAHWRGMRAWRTGESFRSFSAETLN